MAFVIKHTHVILVFQSVAFYLLPLEFLSVDLLLLLFVLLFELPLFLEEDLTELELLLLLVLVGVFVLTFDPLLLVGVCVRVDVPLLWLLFVP